MTVIAIDGAAGVGKSTLARRLAETLDLPYLNTGLMYRAVTLEAIRRGIDLGDGDALAAIAAALTFDLERMDGVAELSIDGSPPGQDLRSADVETAVSGVSRHPSVRVVLRDEQRRLSAGGGVVEGRDIGSVVLPDADVKLFLTATPDERATRRAVERNADAGSVGGALRERDALDARVNPFVAADDAVEISTTGKDADAVFAEALGVVRERTQGPP
ncbi:MAG: (d)CMP kinase [Actinomycetota bacterium]